MDSIDIPRYPMRVVARRTALSPHVIRVWERRYGAVDPPRTGTNRRLYSDRDIHRLALLREATTQGHSIGLIAKRSLEELNALVREGSAYAAKAKPSAENTRLLGGSADPGMVAQCLAAVAQLDSLQLDILLGRAVTELTLPEFLETLVAPLMEQIGAKWRDGEMRVAHEHFASDVIRGFLTARRATHGSRNAGPAVVVTTPAGQVHEIGALMASVVACADGWRDIYMGPNLPAEDIIAAVRASDARAVALSLIYPADAPAVEAELQFLRRHLPENVTIFVGGRATSGYRDILAEIGAEVCPELKDFRAALERLRTSVTRPQTA